VVNIRNEKHHRIQRASPCEGAHGDILHYPKAVLHGDPNDSSSVELISGKRKMINHRTPFPHADRQTCRREVEQRQNNRRFCASDDEEVHGNKGDNPISSCQAKNGKNIKSSCYD